MQRSHLLTSGEVATRLGVNRTTVHRWAESGKLPVAEVIGGMRFFDPDSLAELGTESTEAAS